MPKHPVAAEILDAARERTPAIPLTEAAGLLRMSHGALRCFLSRHPEVVPRWYILQGRGKRRIRLLSVRDLETIQYARMERV